jgi:hypothetical protein
MVARFEVMGLVVDIAGYFSPDDIYRAHIW